MSETEETEINTEATIFDRRWPVLFIYLVLTLVMTFPLVIRFASHVPAGAVDLWQNYWNFWWWKTALLELHQSPYHTGMLFHPSGATMAFYTHSPFNMLIAMPVTLLFGPGAAYNFCIIIAVWLSGFFGWMLGKDLTGDGRAGFLCGLIFTFFPQHIEQTLEHLNLFSTQFIPLTSLYLIRLARDGGWKNIVGLGIAFALNTLSSWHLGFMLTLFLVPLFCFELAKRSRPIGRTIIDNGAAGVLATVIVLPFMMPLILGMLGSDGDNAYFQKPQQDRGVDLLFSFIPNFHHPVLGGFTLDYWAKNRGYGAAGFVSYLGFLPLGLAVYAAFKKQKGVVAWGLLFIGFFVLGLGARPWVGGEIVEIPLPFAVFEHLPMLSLLRVANRFVTFASLALGVLAALAWVSIEHKRSGLFYLICAVILFEYLWLPYPMIRDDFPVQYEVLAEAEPNDAVLDFPFNCNGMTVHNMRAQVVHGRKIAGGYLSTIPPEPIDAILGDPVLSVLVGREPLKVAPEVPDELDTAHLRELGFTTIVMHKYRTNGYQQAQADSLAEDELFEAKIVSRLGGISDATFAQARTVFQSACGPATFEDDLIVVFEIPIN